MIRSSSTITQDPLQNDRPHPHHSTASDTSALTPSIIIHPSTPQQTQPQPPEQQHPPLHNHYHHHQQHGPNGTLPQGARHRLTRLSTSPFFHKCLRNLRLLILILAFITLILDAITLSFETNVMNLELSQISNQATLLLTPHLLAMVFVLFLLIHASDSTCCCFSSAIDDTEDDHERDQAYADQEQAQDHDYHDQSLHHHHHRRPQEQEREQVQQEEYEAQGRGSGPIERKRSKQRRRSESRQEDRLETDSFGEAKQQRNPSYQQITYHSHEAAEDMGMQARYILDVHGPLTGTSHSHIGSHDQSHNKSQSHPYQHQQGTQDRQIELHAPAAPHWSTPVISITPPSNDRHDIISLRDDGNSSRITHHISRSSSSSISAPRSPITSIDTSWRDSSPASSLGLPSPSTAHPEEVVHRTMAPTSSMAPEGAISEEADSSQRPNLQQQQQQQQRWRRRRSTFYLLLRIVWSVGLVTLTLYWPARQMQFPIGYLPNFNNGETSHLQHERDHGNRIEHGNASHGLVGGGHGWDNNHNSNSNNAQILIPTKTASQYTGSNDDKSGPGGPGGEGTGGVTNDGGGYGSRHWCAVEQAFGDNQSATVYCQVKTIRPGITYSWAILLIVELGMALVVHGKKRRSVEESGFEEEHELEGQQEEEEEEVVVRRRQRQRLEQDEEMVETRTTTMAPSRIPPTDCRRH